VSRLKKTAIWLTLLSVAVKVSGMLRESVIGHQFGASDYTDGYNMAFAFITLILAMIAGGFNNVFLPLYMKLFKTESVATEHNANGLLNSMVLIFAGLSIVGAATAQWFVPQLFSSGAPLAVHTAVHITRIFFLAIIAVALNGMLESYLQTRRIFVPTQVSKLVATLGGAVAALFFSKSIGIYALAYGFVGGTIVGVLIQFYYLIRSDFGYQPTLRVDREFRNTFLVLIVPALLNSVVGQINLLVNQKFASGTMSGAVTYLTNASLLISIPNTIYSASIAAIIFTLLSDQVNDQKKFQDTFHMGTELSYLTLAPMLVGLAFFGDETLAFIYQRGAYTAAMTQHAYAALLFYLPLIVLQGLQFIVSKSMYAQGKTAIVLRISVTTIVMNIVLSYLLVDRFGYRGLALSSSLVALYYLVVSSVVVYRTFEKAAASRLFVLLTRGSVPALLMAGALWGLDRLAVVNSMYSLFQVGVAAVVGGGVYAAALYAFYRPGFTRLAALARRRRG
jgi:putative peptidoglycan lipid II flippase